MCVRVQGARGRPADEREAARRECLNLGHTLGHAIEKVAGYGAVPHGLAVAEGMRFAARLAERVSVRRRRVDAPRRRRLLDALRACRTIGQRFDAGRAASRR